MNAIPEMRQTTYAIFGLEACRQPRPKRVGIWTNPVLMPVAKCVRK